MEPQTLQELLARMQADQGDETALRMLAERHMPGATPQQWDEMIRRARGTLGSVNAQPVPRGGLGRVLMPTLGGVRG